MPSTASSIQRVGVIALYLFLNISINLLNKFIISRTGFAFPLAVSISHMLFSIIALAPLMLRGDYRPLHRHALRKNAFGLAVIGASFSVNLAMNNFSLTRISLSLNQMIRSSIPVVTAACSIIIDGVIPTGRELVALAAITFGVCAVLAEDVHADTTGIILCAVSTVANGIMMSMSGAVLQDKLDVWRLSFYQAPIVLLALLPVYFFAEHDRVVEFVKGRNNVAYTLSLLVLTCVIALAYNAVHGIAIKMTSATTTTVIGQGKILMLLVLSAVLLGERDFFDWKTVIGGLIAVFGFTAYSLEREKLNERGKK